MEIFENKQVSKKVDTSKGQSYNEKEQELIQQLVQSRIEQNAELEFEDLSGYELPPRTQFSMLKKPAVSIKYKELTCNMASIRLFEGVQNVLPIFNSEKQRLVIAPCAEEESSSVEWARIQEKDGAWVNKRITSLEFVEKIYDIMKWDRNCRYKALGRIVNSSRGLVLLFDFSEAIMFATFTTEYVDKDTGEMKKRRTIYYPDKYKGCIGRSYNDYAETQQLTLFEHLEGYTGQTYEDAAETQSQVSNVENGDENDIQ